MFKPPLLLPSSWYEVDNLQGNNERGPSQNWGKETKGQAPHPSPAPSPALMINPTGM